MKQSKKEHGTKSARRDEEKPSAESTSEGLTKRSSLTDRYPRVFVESVRESPLPLPDEKGSLMEDDETEKIQMTSDSEFDFLPAAGQMKLTEIQKAQIKRERAKCMEELNAVLARVRLAMDEYSTAEVELTISESPDPEYEAEEEEQKKREKKIKREKRRAQRKRKFQDDDEEENNRQETQVLDQEKRDREEDGLSESDEDLSDFSDEEDEDNDEEEDEADEKKTKEETWTMPGQVKRKISQKMLIRRSKRRRVLKLITTYLELCVEREDIIRQMQSWIESTVDEELMKPARVFLFSPELLMDDLPLGLTSEMQALGATLVRLKSIADSLGIGESTTDESLDESSDKPPTKARGPRRIVYSVDELDNADNWVQAEIDIETIMGQAIATIPVRKIRLNLENARKQFLLMTQLVARRNVNIRQLDEKVVDLEGELVKTKRHNDELRKNNKKAKVKAEKLQYQNEDLQSNMKEQQKIIYELNEKLDEYKRKESYGLYGSSSESSIRDSRESMSVVSLVEKPSQHLAPTGEKVMIQTPKSSKAQIVVASDSTADEAAKPAPPTQTSEESNKEIAQLKQSLERVQEELKIEKEKSAAFEQEFATLQTDKVKVEQERSELEIQLEDVKRENERAVEELTQKLEDMERENKRMAGEIECNEEMIKYQEERLGQFMEEIQCLEERMMSFPPTPATMSVASMAGGPRRERRKTSLQLGLEPQTARQMVAKVKQQYEAELVSLKDHMGKETQRHQAELRRLEHEHKKDVQNIHKEALLLLRALNRFKDSVATLLDREHLSQEAHAIRSHAPLPLDENFGDTRQMLARMAILSNEMLISVELHLSRGLMSKRLELKDTPPGRMDYPAEALRKSRDQAGRMKGTTDELHIEGKQLELHVWRLLEEGRRQDVMDRFRELQAHVSTQEKDIQTVKKTGEEKMKKKEAQLKRVLRRESEVKKTVDEQKNIIKNLASIWKSRRIGQKYIRREDQERNLQLLEEAMKENEISTELFESTKKLIKVAMDFPRNRFIEIVKKYVHFRRVQEIQETVKRMRMETNINDRVLLGLKEAEERMIKQKESWRQKKEQFIKARADVLEQLYQVLTQVHEETGILLVKPMDLIPRLEEIKEDVKEIDQADILEAASIPKERAKLRKAELLAQAAAAAREPPLTTVEGTGVTCDGGQASSWKVMSSFPTAMITTPKLLDMDINRSRQAAQDILARVSEGSLDAKSVSLPPINFFPSLYGYFGKPNIRKTKSEPSQQRKKLVKTFRSRVRFLPPIATLYPEDDEKEIS